MDAYVDVDVDVCMYFGNAILVSRQMMETL